LNCWDSSKAKNRARTLALTPPSSPFPHPSPLTRVPSTNKDHEALAKDMKSLSERLGVQYQVTFEK